jgi:hypothetical protein
MSTRPFERNASSYFSSHHKDKNSNPGNNELIAMIEKSPGRLGEERRDVARDRF